MGRKRKTAPSTSHTGDELAILEKYSALTIKPGSLSARGEPTVMGTKRVFTLLCACGAERVVAVQDAFQVRGCVACTKEAKTEAIKAKRAAKAAAKKPAKKKERSDEK